ncbi:hypothetical protein OAO51_06205 [Nitrosomonadaceae bacterium]|nr:hypothetical protein [Nitrosomonadaceae bacterium]
MEGLILAIGLSSESFLSLNKKAYTFRHPPFRSLAFIFLLLTLCYMAYAFINFEWYVPLLGIVIGSPIAAILYTLLITIHRTTCTHPNEIELHGTSIVEVIFNIAAIILVINSLG